MKITLVIGISFIRIFTYKDRNQLFHLSILIVMQISDFFSKIIDFNVFIFNQVFDELYFKYFKFYELNYHLQVFSEVLFLL